jgi:hypothetical protein
VSRPFYFTIPSAKALIGKDRPHTKGQVIIRENTGGSWVEVRIGLILCRGYTYHRVTRADIEFADFKNWNDALLAAITRMEYMVKPAPANPFSVTLVGSQYQDWSRLNELCDRHNVAFSELPDVLGRLIFQIQILNQESNENAQQK